MSDHLKVARRVLDIETKALQQLSASLSDSFVDTVERLKSITGRIILVGVGKSGHVARKIAATLSSPQAVPPFMSTPRKPAMAIWA